MNTLKLTFLSLVLVAMVAPSLSAQDTQDRPAREIGIGSGNLSNNFSLIYKKELEENRYRSYSASVFITYVDRQEKVMADLSFSIATENRKYIKDKFKFIRGFYYGGRFKNYQDIFTITPIVGYQLGFQYDINEELYVGVTIAPQVNTEIGISDGNIGVSTAIIAFSTDASLSIVYRF